MDKKSIVLLVISGVVLCVAIVFAVWSFSLDLSVAENNNLVNAQQKINNTINVNNEVSEETKDFSVTYTDFTVEDEKGNQIKLSDYQNQPVMVLFWSNENDDSVEMLKRMNQQYDTYKQTIRFIAIKAEEIDTELQDIKVPIYYDQNQEIMKMYNVTELPTMLYITKDNEVFNAKIGLTSEDALKANLDILSENF